MHDRLASLASRCATRLLALPTLILGGLGVFVCGFTAGLMITLFPDPAVVEALQRYEPSVVTHIYDDAGQPITEWSLESRELFGFTEIPQHFIDAVITAEDRNFFRHSGIDPQAMLRALFIVIREGRYAQGGSTLTMQLPRNLDRRLGGDTWLPKDKRIQRKIQELIYSIQIERHFSKQRIFEIYANQIFMGHNIYGFQAAADHYFGKPVSQIDLAEAAMLAGMIPRPNYYNPYENPGRALDKRNVILDRMQARGYLTEAETVAARAQPLGLAVNRDDRTLAPYFTEEIRKELIKRYGADGIYRSGLEVYTTLSRELQAAAETALTNGLRNLDKRQGWRGAPRNLRREAIEPSSYSDPSWKYDLEVGDVAAAVVLAVFDDRARLRIADRIGELDSEDVEWTRTSKLTELLTETDVVSVRIEAIAEDGTLDLGLDQEPAVQGAVLVIENNTGEVKAMVGGHRFDSSEFNRSIQAVRQTGSVFKPFVYTTALANGLSASALFLDEPHTFRDPTTRQPYSPSNYRNEYIGITSLVEALSRSRNVVTVKVQERVGVEKVIKTARRFGLTAPLQPFLSLGLGVIDVSLWEIARAYAVLPNQGVLVEPHLVRAVRDRQGRPQETAQRKAEQVLDSDIAYLMTRMLMTVVERGSGIRARALARELELPLGGKTGTTDDFSDAWFVGFSPYHTIAVWVGFDQKQSLGNGEAGSRAALPIWIETMRAAGANLAARQFSQPATVLIRRIDPRTGLLAGPDCKETLEAAYLAGTEPRQVCTPAEHRILRLPSYQQAYFLRNGRIDPSIYGTGSGR